MLGMVTFISTLVVIYASGYMHGDQGYWRFFAYVALFVFSMTMLVSVSNFVLLYVFWEAVGLCSYLLVGFWFEKPSAAAAGMKAFLVNRVGDFGFALGVFLIWTTFGTLDFHDSKVETVPPVGQLARRPFTSIRRTSTIRSGRRSSTAFSGIGVLREHPYEASGAITAICLLLLRRRLRQERAVPAARLAARRDGRPHARQRLDPRGHDGHGRRLHGRPLHAALSPPRRTPRRWWRSIGGFTALLAALIALTQTDLKRILAYSTVSQLGYMFLALGTGSQLGVTSRHVPPVHARLLQGPVVPRRGQRDARHGRSDRHARVRRPAAEDAVTHWTFLIGCLALAGVVPFAGFWSKDAILAAVHEKASEAPASIYAWLYYSAHAHGLPHRVLHFPRLLPHLPRRGADSQGGRPSRPRVAARDDRPAGDPGGRRAAVGAYFQWTRRFPQPRRLPHADAVAARPLQAEAAKWRASLPLGRGHHQHDRGRWPASAWLGCSTWRGRAWPRRRRTRPSRWGCMPCRTASSSSTRFTRR